MIRYSRLLTNGVIATLIGVSSIAATTTTAAAYIACNRYGDCWQTTQRYHYPIHLSVRYFDGSDNYWRHQWRRHHNGYRWHDDGNRDDGYWDRDRSWHNF